METNGTPQTKADDWRSYDRVLLPPIEDLHRLEVYEEEVSGYDRLRTVLEDDGLAPGDITETVKQSGLRGRGGIFDGNEVELYARRGRAPALPRLQRRRERAGNV